MTKRQTAGKKLFRIPPSQRRNRAADRAAAAPAPAKARHEGVRGSDEGQAAKSGGEPTSP